MTTPFLICGLPRSRTAWFSVLMTGKDSFCYHEPLSDCADSFDEILELWGKGKCAYTGMADHLLGFRLGEILEVVRPRTLVVERALDDVCASLARFDIPAQPFCDQLVRAMAPHLDHPLVRVVAYEALDDATMIVECMRWLCPDVGIDALRLQQMMAMNIQADMGKVKQAAFRRQAIFQRFMAEAA